MFEPKQPLKFHRYAIVGSSATVANHNLSRVVNILMSGLQTARYIVSPTDG